MILVSKGPEVLLQASLSVCSGKQGPLALRVAQGPGEQHKAHGGPALSFLTEAVMSWLVASLEVALWIETKQLLQRTYGLGWGEEGEPSPASCLVHFPLRDLYGGFGLIHMYTQGRTPSVAFSASNILSLLLGYLPHHCHRETGVSCSPSWLP